MVNREGQRWTITDITEGLVVVMLFLLLVLLEVVVVVLVVLIGREKQLRLELVKLVELVL